MVNYMSVTGVISPPLQIDIGVHGYIRIFPVIFTVILVFAVLFAMADVTAEEEVGVKASSFSSISEDILINIFSKLEEDPRHLASLACVCPRFYSIIRSVCWKRKCMSVIPAVVADLLQANGRADRLAEPPGGWSALQKLAVCCPGLWHAGILLENSDLGLERAIGPSHQYKVETRLLPSTSAICVEGTSDSYSAYPWTIFDDINFHAEYEAELGFALNSGEEGFSGNGNRGFAENLNGNDVHNPNRAPENPVGGDIRIGVGENPNGQIAEKPKTVPENPIGEKGEGFEANPCAVMENAIGEIADNANPRGEIEDNADPIVCTENSNEENINIANKLNRDAGNPVGEMGYGITQNPKGQIPDKPNRVVQNPVGEMDESCKGNPCTVTECPNGEIADTTDLIVGTKNPEGDNRNIANKLNRVAENLIGEMGNGTTQNPNGQILDKPHRVAENPIGVMGESCRGNPCAVTECLTGEIADNANPIAIIAGVEGKMSEFSKFTDNESGSVHNPPGVTCNSRDPIELKRKENPSYDQAGDHQYCDTKKQKTGKLAEPHLASDIWNLTREQGNKLLASRFRGDSLYICDWPGCEHSEEKRNYRLFRGIFKNFRNSYVWRNIRDMKAKKSSLNCAFCSSMGTWDMLATFCLKRSFEYHDDGEPSVRAYVCENGHVAGAWTDRPMYK